MKQHIIRLTSFTSPTRFDWFLYFTAFLVLHIPAIINFHNNNGDANAYLLFAQSLLDGKLTLPAMESYRDMILFEGAHYLPYPPLPSVILLPFVAIFGATHVNTVFISLAISCLNLFLLHRILLKIKISPTYMPWITIAFFFGTGYWYALFISHHVYAFAHINACMFVLLFLNELLGSKQRWWLMGLYIGCSFLTRQFTFLYILFALGYLFSQHYNNTNDEKFAWKKLGALLGSFAFCVFIYLLYNHLRFGNFLDTGYAHIIYTGVLKERVDQYGVFNIRYFLFNLYSFLIKGFHIRFEGPGLMKIKDMDLWGTSLLAASPFLVASFKASWSRWIKISAWLTITAILLGILFYHNNGFHQINTMRFSLDFMPLLIILTALGAHRVPGWLLRGMIVYAVVLNLVSFLIHALYE